jgi:glucose/arabinose dehydrogenase
MHHLQIPTILAASLLAAVTACAQTPKPSPAPGAAAPACTPLEAAAAKAPDQKPAFAGQTRACGVKTAAAFEVTVIAKGLEKPWAVEPLPDGGFLVTEKAGRIRFVSAAGEIGEPIGGVLPIGEKGGVTSESSQGGLPPVTARGQGGLLDIALSPDFAKDRTIFWSFSEQREGGSGTSVARGVLSPDRKTLSQVKVIFRAMPTYNNGLHFGSRLAFSPDGKLFVTTGDRFDKAVTRPQAQHLTSHLGKVIRINPDGTVPADNPFSGEGSLPEVWSIGHRNLQSATIDDQGRLWTVEHGAQGGDELNLIEKGKNYGWPIISYGEEYSGEPIPGNVTAKAGLEQPVYYWDPVIAPSGMQFYTGKLFPEWQGSIFIGGLASQKLVRVVIKDGRVVGEEHLLTDRGKRIRDVRQGPDGALYVVTDESNGELLRIAPSVK